MTDAIMNEASEALLRVIRSARRSSPPDDFLRGDLGRALVAVAAFLDDRTLTLAGVAKAAQRESTAATGIEVGMRVVHTKTDGRIRGRVKRIRADVEVDGLAAHAEHSYNIANLEPEEPQPASTVLIAIERAGFKISPDLEGNPTLWCRTCGRDSGFHYTTCEKSR